MSEASNFFWRRYIKHPLGIAGGIILIFFFIVAILGYFIIPDSSPNANNQIPEIALKNPGFQVLILSTPVHHREDNSSLFQFWMNGRSLQHKDIPIQQYQVIGDSVIAETYAGENPENKKPVKGKRFAVALSELNEKKDLEKSPGEISAKFVSLKRFYLGTDQFGRDILSRLVLGSRVSLTVGLMAVIMAISIGLFLGLIAGYSRSWADDLIMLTVNTVWSLPTVLLVFAIVLIWGKGISTIFIAIGLTMWVDVTRLVRAQVKSIREQDFVKATEAMGFKRARIIWRHILPNVVAPVFILSMTNFATAILLESGLSYLGFGIQPPMPSWGNMLHENYGYAIAGKPFLAMIPAFAILLLVLAFTMVGNALRQANMNDK